MLENLQDTSAKKTKRIKTHGSKTGRIWVKKNREKFARMCVCHVEITYGSNEQNEKKNNNNNNRNEIPSFPKEWHKRKISRREWKEKEFRMSSSFFRIKISNKKTAVKIQRYNKKKKKRREEKERKRRISLRDSPFPPSRETTCPKKRKTSRKDVSNIHSEICKLQGCSNIPLCWRSTTWLAYNSKSGAS